MDTRGGRDPVTRHGGDIYSISEKYGFPPGEIMDFSSNINLLGPPPSLKNILADNFSLIQSYPDPDYRLLKRAIGGFIGAADRHIIPGNGATELIYLVPRALAPRRALIAAPAFSEYGKALKQAGASITWFRLREEDGFRINLAALLREIRKGYDFIVICNPNNPTGTFTPPEVMEAIVQGAWKSDSTVMVDESFIEFIPEWKEKSAAGLTAKYPNLLVLRSMTKFFAIPGIRLGYLLCRSRQMSARFNSFKEPWTVNMVADLSARRVLDDRDYMERSLTALETEKSRLTLDLERMKNVTVFQPSANFILLKIACGGEIR